MGGFVRQEMHMKMGMRFTENEVVGDKAEGRLDLQGIGSSDMVFFFTLIHEDVFLLAPRCVSELHSLITN